MTKAEALVVLDLRAGATAEEIRDQFRTVAMSLHPDKGGDHVGMATLVAARDCLLGIDPGEALVPVSAVTELVTTTIASVLAPRQRELTTERQTERLRRLLTSPLRRARNRAAAVGVVSGGLAVLTTQIGPLLQTGGSIAGTVSAVLAVCAAAGGVMFWLEDYRAKQLESVVEDLKENLADKALCLDLLYALGLADATQLWALEELTRALGNDTRDDATHRVIELRQSIQRIAWAVGPDEVSRLILAKGLEVGVLDEVAVQAERMLRLRYRLHPAILAAALPDKPLQPTGAIFEESARG